MFGKEVHPAEIESWLWNQAVKVLKFVRWATKIEKE
jgi:hypothetical protein